MGLYDVIIFGLIGGCWVGVMIILAKVGDIRSNTRWMRKRMERADTAYELWKATLEAKLKAKAKDKKE